MSDISGPDSSGPAPSRLDQLTSLRFFAALAVLSSHLWILQESPNLLRPLAATVFHEGYAGVSFFFVLSGFILSHTYKRKLATRGISKTKYFALRLARIYPLHLLTALPFAIGLLLAHDPGALAKIFMNLSLLQAWAPGKDLYFSLNAPSWSLSDELFFYAAFAFLAFVSLQRLVQSAAALMLMIALMVGGLLVTGHASWSVNNAIGFPHWLTYVLPAVRLLDFILGMLIYHVPKLRLSRRASTVLEAGSAAAWLCAMYVFSKLALPEVLRAQLLYLPFMAFVIFAFAQGGGALSRQLGAKWIVLLGEASFALYMIHLPVLNFGNDLFERFGEPIPLIAYALGMTALCVALSVLTFKLIERPIQNNLRRKISLLLPF